FSSIFLPPNRAVLIQSTISGNKSDVYVGGMYSNAANNYFLSSTVAFNTSVNGHKGSKYYASGVATGTYFGSQYISLQSALISNNTYGLIESDLSIYEYGLNTTSFNSGPAYSLVRVPSTPSVTTKLPSGTIKFACPLLGPLRDNGGFTRTHALLSGSPAI